MKSYQIIYIHKNRGAPEVRTIEGGDESVGLKPLQGLVEGMIELVHLYMNADNNFDMYINEEGRYTHAMNIFIPVNPEEPYFGADGLWDIHGPVVICKGDEEGNTVGLSDEDVKLLLPFLNKCRENTERVLADNG